jgi:DNA-binding GntR family transcriptional regulator
LMRNWLNFEVADFRREDLEKYGLYDLLHRRGVRMRLANQAIGAQAATARQARLLRTTKGAALLTMKRTAYDHSGRAIEFGDHVYRADRYSFETTVLAR